jgi:hypothetical protein
LNLFEEKFQMPIRLNYSRMSDAMRDAEAIRFAERLARSFDSNAYWDVSNELAIMAVRVLVAEGKIDIKETPILVAFENKDIGYLNEDGQIVDAEGRPAQIMPGFCDFHLQLQMRGQMATYSRKFNKLTDKQKLQYAEIYNDWVKDNLLDILTPGTEFILAPDAAGQKSIPNPEIRKPNTVQEWTYNEEEMMWFLVFEKGAIPAPAVEMCLFDKYGDRYVAAPFNQTVALAKIGITAEQF